MYTSAIKTGMKYLAASIALAVLAAVYGLFSHGVYSYFMTYAFMIPLLGGAMPHLIAAMKETDSSAENGMNEEVRHEEGEEQAARAAIFDAGETQLAIIATLTAGSLIKGVLDIYGTTNRLLAVYPAIAVLILGIALVSVLRRGGCISRPMKNK